jgi:hypothetical protein
MEDRFVGKNYHRGDWLTTKANANMQTMESPAPTLTLLIKPSILHLIRSQGEIKAIKCVRSLNKDEKKKLTKINTPMSPGQRYRYSSDKAQHTFQQPIQLLSRITTPA